MCVFAYMCAHLSVRAMRSCARVCVHVSVRAFECVRACVRAWLCV